MIMWSISDESLTDSSDEKTGLKTLTGGRFSSDIHARNSFHSLILYNWQASSKS